ncbi:carbohydrate ABC transporter permease [Paraoerskovia marina]|uniref:Carbohydrate ABC transporter membrane protein 2, CUT1 family n=1 Tax=Paraoerskovia marina TaxID=545619 RepID=A0A1H1M702_9CELL|nr:carbohydrate ABC transporter permease [Paraoerskovia marina]SDR81779.1 carbohydrate ABC transporter membrane protein 2, CUT1 family [Paraoerskovia marina]
MTTSLSAPAAHVAPQEPQQLRPDRARHTRGGLVLRYTLLALVFALLVGPFLWQFLTSLKDSSESIYTPNPIPQNPTMENYRTVAETIPVFRYIGNSLIVATSSALLNVIFGSMAGYALARLRFRGRTVADVMFLATIIIPFEVIMVSVFLTMRSIGLVDSLAGVILPTAATGLSIILMRTAFLGLPREIEEAAMLDGANSWQRFRTIALPSVKGSISVVAIFAFVFAWDDFLWPLVILKNPDNYTLTVGIQYLSGTFSANQRVIAAGTMIAVIPLLALFFSLQRWFFMGVGEGGVKG